MCLWCAKYKCTEYVSGSLSVHCQCVLARASPLQVLGALRRVERSEMNEGYTLHW